MDEGDAGLTAQTGDDSRPVEDQGPDQPDLDHDRRLAEAAAAFSPDVVEEDDDDATIDEEPQPRAQAVRAAEEPPVYMEIHQETVENAAQNHGASTSEARYQVQAVPGESLERVEEPQAKADPASTVGVDVIDPNSAPAAKEDPDPYQQHQQLEQQAKPEDPYQQQQKLAQQTKPEDPPGAHQSYATDAAHGHQHQPQVSSPAQLGMNAMESNNDMVQAAVHAATVAIVGAPMDAAVPAARYAPIQPFPQEQQPQQDLNTEQPKKETKTRKRRVGKITPRKLPKTTIGGLKTDDEVMILHTRQVPLIPAPAPAVPAPAPAPGTSIYEAASVALAAMTGTQEGQPAQMHQPPADVNVVVNQEQPAAPSGAISDQVPTNQQVFGAEGVHYEQPAPVAAPAETAYHEDNVVTEVTTAHQQPVHHQQQVHQEEQPTPMEVASDPTVPAPAPEPEVMDHSAVAGAPVATGTADTESPAADVATSSVVVTTNPSYAALSPSALASSPTTPMSKHDEKWNDMFGKLLQYKIDNNGSTFVPQCYPENQKLGRWVHYQRVEYWIYQDNGKGKINPDRIARLEAIGFEWDPQRAQWYRLYERLVKYHEQHGSCKVPKGYTQDKELANWVRNQRLEHANRMKGKKSRMTDERFKLLNDLGFRWSQAAPGRKKQVMGNPHQMPPLPAPRKSGNGGLSIERLEQDIKSAVSNGTSYHEGAHVAATAAAVAAQAQTGMVDPNIPSNEDMTAAAVAAAALATGPGHDALYGTQDMGAYSTEAVAHGHAGNQLLAMSQAQVHDAPVPAHHLGEVQQDSPSESHVHVENPSVMEI